MSRITTSIAAVFCAMCLACGDGNEDEHSHEGDDEHSNGPTAKATFAPKSGNTTLAGTATFSGETGKVSIKVELTGAPPGEHGLHIHMTPDCADEMAMNAGGHWNPGMHTHGAPGAAVSHLGDIGNFTVAADGTATHTATNALWELGTGTANDVKNKAVVVHAMVDDLKTDPTGNAGGRIGCGVIQ